MESQPSTDWKELIAGAFGNALTGYAEGLATSRTDSRGTASQLQYQDVRAETYSAETAKTGFDVKAMLLIGGAIVVGIIVLKKVL